MRTLVEVPVMPYNNSVAIVSFYQDNIKYYFLRLKGANLNPQDAFFAYERCCPPSLEFVAPVLTIPHGNSILAPLYKDLIQKLKVM